jgi:hypothetical protein
MIVNIPKIKHLATLATSLAFALSMGCSPKADASMGTTTGSTAATSTPVTTNPVSQYQFITPLTESDLQKDSIYGYLIAKAAPGFKESTFGHMGLSIEGKISLKGFNYYRLHKDSNVLEALQMLQANKGILFAEADQLLKADAGITLDNLETLAKSEEYSLYLTKTIDAWKTYGFGPNKPTVVDIDTGINWQHEDFQNGTTSIVKHAYSWYDLDNGNALISPSSTYAIDPIDYLGTAHTLTTTPSPSDEDSHGIHTAGTIAAQGNNGKGVAGVCWNTDLVSYKGLLNGSGSTWAIYGSLYHLLNWKTTTNYTHTIPVNMSLGGAGASTFAIEAVEACTENGIVIIASMGNTGQNQVNYPAAYQGVIAVGASNGQDKKVHFSTSGSHISVTAPGYDIISTGGTGDDTYESMSGTSMSAPFVTGLVAYMLTWNPDLTPAQIRTYLEKNADFIEGATGFTETNGWGRVNTLKTIGAVIADVTAKTTPASNYLNAPLKVTVQNTFAGTTTPLTSTPVYLYQSDPEGRITNFVASALTSFDTDPLLAAPGTVSFNLLRPGTYVARCNVSGIQAYSPLITVTTASTSAAVTVQFNSSVYNVQTLPDAAPSSQTTDDIVNVYDFNSGKLLTSVDIGGLDTASVMTAPNQILMINLKPYQTYVGEYALWVGTSLYATATAPGTNAAPATGGAAGSTSHSSATPQVITVNKLYNGALTAATDWYKVTVP